MYPKHVYRFLELTAIRSTANVKEIRVTIDLDADKGKTRRPDGPKNQWLLLIKPTGTIRLAALRGYLKGQSSWDNSVLECMSFLDHVLRQGPSERMKLIKRTFFNNASETHPLNNYTEAIKGIYSTIRLNETINYPGGLGLGVNVDVSNQTFWVGQKFEQLARNYLVSVKRQWAEGHYAGMCTILKPIRKEGKEGPYYEQSDAFKALRKLHNIRFEVQHRGKSQCTKEYKVKRFTFDRQKGEQTAKTITFVKKDKNGGPDRTMNIMQYYKSQYNATLQWPDMPLIETNRAGFFPMEVCQVQRFNSYPFKLDPQQTQAMIKFAVQRPPLRRKEIEKMVANLNWGDDKYLSKFGITIQSTMAVVPATMIKNPSLQFHNSSKNKGQLNPGVSGRWDLRGMKFALTNKEGPLKSWAIVVLERCVDQSAAKNFGQAFKQAYQSHGGSVANDPLVLEITRQEDLGMGISRCFNATGGTFKSTPQILFFVVGEKSTTVYERLKKSTDCRFAFPSQVLLAQNVNRAAGQYCSNVCLKVNAKLGGATSGLTGESFFGKVPTMIIGADVSHAAPGSPQASMAAVCASIDPEALRYRAAVQTNGYRTEIISQSNIKSIIPEMIQAYGRENKKTPLQIFYFRDGVSEGQFAHVMEHEVEGFKRMFSDKGYPIPKFTVIVATKRHHIRFFPEKPDKNGNPYPGTLVEREVTHPFHYDFYLCSHVAIQGTARPVHYNVIHDEIKWSPDKLQKMIYHHCYQYCRATTPVSLHPAVYYAHLASNRARAHENLSFTDKNQQSTTKGGGSQSAGWGAKKDNNSSSTAPKPTESPPLLPLGGMDAREDCRDRFRNTMWWV